jgi:hypothetical protein
MAQRSRWVLVIGGLLSVGCAAPTLEQRRTAASPSIAALQEGSFDQAGKRAEEQIDADAANPYARLVRAVVRYKKAMHQLSLDARTAVIGGVAAGGLNQKFLATTFEDGESELAFVEADLAQAATDPDLSVELCLACWEVDWNGNGRIDQSDRLLFQIERDERGHDLPDDDPRRKPTFRFDAGDVAWARAFVSFQRAALDVVLAYDLSEVSRIVEERHGASETVVLRLIHPDRIDQAKRRILEGLDRSDEARRSYLAETDDDREWVPSPRQHSHPMPLPVDQALYDTWEGVLGDVRRLVRGEDGLRVADLMEAFDDHHGPPPRGYVDVGGLFSHPRDITLRLRDLDRLVGEEDVEGLLSMLLGDRYVPSMKASPLPRRLLRMKGEIDRHEEALAHKLRYLFWLN